MCFHVFQVGPLGCREVAGSRETWRGRGPREDRRRPRGAGEAKGRGRERDWALAHAKAIRESEGSQGETEGLGGQREG